MKRGARIALERTLKIVQKPNRTLLNIYKNMRFNNSIKIRIVMAVIILISLHSNAKNCVEEIALFNKRLSDEVSSYDRVFGTLKPLLPSHGSVGYITDMEDVKPFYLAQYALSPIFLERGFGHQLIAAHFEKPLDYELFCEKNRLLPLKRIGSNIFLFKKNK